MTYLGDFTTANTVYVFFNTFDSNDPSASVTLTGLAVTDIEIYKNGGTTQRASDAGYTLLDTDGIDFDGITGIHGFSIDLSDNTDSGFYAAGSEYTVIVSSVTVDGATINFVAATFSIERTGGALALLKGAAGLSVIASDLAQVYSDTTIIASDLVIVASDLLQVYSDTTIIASDVVLIYSDTTVIEAAGGLTAAQDSKLTQIRSDLIIAASDVLQIYSDTTIIASDVVVMQANQATIAAFIDTEIATIISDVAQVYSDTTRIHSDTTQIQSDTAAVEIGVSDTESALVKVYSDTTKVESDAAAIEIGVSDTESALVKVYSDTTAVHSDTTAMHTQTTTIASDLVIVASDVLQVYSDTTHIDSDITLMAGVTQAQIKSDMIEALTADTYAEPGQEAPGATVSLGTKIGYLYKSWRNKKDNDGAETQLYADDGTTVDQVQTTSESGGTVTKGEWATGP